MPLLRIIALLRQAAGFDVASVGIDSIERAAQQRLRANDLRNISQYADLLRRSERELQNLVAAVVISETFFFRYPESFVAFQQFVVERFLFGSQTMRVLSLPCSTGEEPYSLAMCLLEAGLSEKKFQIDAVDISEHLLQIARLGLFGRNSFRGSELRFRDRYFQQASNGFRLCDRVRKCVRFEQGNLLKGRFRFGSEPYDFIFCRNLLIYFYPEAQEQALKSLKQLLIKDGLLFVAPAETRLLTQHGFASMKWPLTFAFQKSESIPFPMPAGQKLRKVATPAKAQRIEIDGKPAMANPTNATPETVKHRWVPDLTFAERLADRGRFGEAAEICEVSLREDGPSARAFHLLGLIRDGAGDRHQASEFYRKALFLEPDHYEALMHLALIKDQNGDRTAAETLKKRAHRVLERMK